MIAKKAKARKRQSQRNISTEYGKIPLVDIAEQIGVSEGTIRGWKCKDDWCSMDEMTSESDLLDFIFQFLKNN